MRNKMIALLLCGSMVLASLAGCGGNSQDEKGKENDVSKVEEGPEQAEDAGEGEQAGSEEKISFSMTGVNTSAGVDYLSGAVGQYIMDEFNVDFEIRPNGWDGSGERFSIEATSGELADLNVWLDFSWGAYYEYVNQGLFAPLPDDWKERWPNLSHMVEKTGYMESLEVDGKTYGILHATFGNLTEVEVATNHWALYLRKDLAEQVGMNDLCADNTITLSELKEYLQKVKEAGLIDNSVIGSGPSELICMFEEAFGIPRPDYYNNGEGYVWMPTQEGFEEPVSAMQEWYQEGLIDADFYSNEVEYYRDLFYSGQIPCMFSSTDSGNIQNVTTMIGYEEGSGFGNVAVMHVTDEDGNVYANETSNYWLCSVFSPDIDDATMERLLDIVDWACTTDGQMITGVGIEGSEWIYDENGNVEFITPDKSWYPERLAYFMLGWCGDDLVASGLMTAPDKMPMVEYSKELYALRSSGTVFSLPREYNTYEGELKTAYNGAVNITTWITQVVCNGEDVKSSLADYIEANRNLWEPLLEDVNAKAGY